MIELTPEEQRLMALGRLQEEIMRLRETLEGQDAAVARLYELALVKDESLLVRRTLAEAATQLRGMADSNRRWLGDLEERLTRMQAE